MFDPKADGIVFREKNGLKDHFVLLYAGAHGMSNDLDVVIKAADLLRDEPSIRIVLLGSGKEKPRLQAAAVELGLENVLFLPPVSKLEMRDALSGADACLAILKPIEMYKTTYPNKVFDYMAAGRPVILAIDGVIKQVVEEADAGVAVPPGDPSALASAIRTLAGDPELCRKLGKNGRNIVEKNFSREELAGKFTTLVKTMRS
jgi:glycosyltransferase involved in cell wall biosynthesis